MQHVQQRCMQLCWVWWGRWMRLFVPAGSTFEGRADPVLLICMLLRVCACCDGRFDASSLTRNEPATVDMLLCCCCHPAGSCLVLYACAGFCGAALFGHSTRGNVMVNDILGDSLGRLGFGVVYGAMMLYLAAGAAASQYPLRAAIDMALMGARVPMTRPRAVSCQLAALISYECMISALICSVVYLIQGVSLSVRLTPAFRIQCN